MALGVIRAQFYPLNDVAKAGYSSSESSLQSSGTLRLEDPNNFYDCVTSHCYDNGDALVRESLKSFDLLTGDKGVDIYRYNLGSDSSTKIAHRDRIVAFNSLEDRIDFRGLDADRTRPGVQSFAFIGGESFQGLRPGLLGYSKGILKADLNGDFRPDFAIELADSPVITADNFLL